MSQVHCQKCGAALGISEPMGREATCSGCGTDLRACVQCRHYDPKLHNSCRETMADPVEDRERRNFCEYFSFNRASFRPATGEAEKQARARARLEQLFGMGTPGLTPDRKADARARLEGLFEKKPESDD